MTLVNVTSSRWWSDEGYDVHVTTKKVTSFRWWSHECYDVTLEKNV